MRKRDRVQHRLRSIFASEAPNPTSSHQVSPPSAHQASSTSLSTPIVSTAVVPATTAPKDSILEKAFAAVAQRIPEAEKAAFIQASKTLDERALLTEVKTYDVAHKANSSFRSHAERLSKFLDLLNRFMGGVAIGIQSNPEISALAVGAVRIVIDLALKFTVFFSRLTDMVCMFEDYIGPLELYAKAVADITLVEQTVVNAYENVITFGWKARRVFVDASGKPRKCISLRSFMHQHWETFESEFDTIRIDLRHHLDLLLHSVEALHFDAFRVAEQSRQLKDDKIERSGFLAWLSDIDIEKTHQDVYAKKQDGTCQWLIQEPSYKEWFQKSESSLLWCHGKPGIGKSIHASNVIENITAKCGLLDDSDICFVYFNYREPQLGDLSRVVTSLMKQLCRRRSRIPKSLLNAKDDARSPSSIGTEESFVTLIENRSNVFIVFDALDECTEEQRRTIIGFITVVLKSSTSCCVKVFVTSRREMDIAKAFESDQIPTIQIQADKAAPDIAAFARTQVEALRSGQNGQTLYISKDEIAEKIIETLAAKAEGMFLWVKLQLDNLCNVSKAHKDSLVLEALESLPRGLPETYSRIMERIDAQTPYMRGLALKCLTWIVYAQEPLSIRQLQPVLAVNKDHKNTREIELDQTDVIIEACGNLLEKSFDSIRPIHYTVQEYLRKSHPSRTNTTLHQEILDIPAAHDLMSRACLLYLNLMVFHHPVYHLDNMFYISRTNQSLSYTAKYFDYHFTKSSMETENKRHLEIFLGKDSPSLAVILQVRLRNIKYERSGYRPVEFYVSAGDFLYGSLLYHVPEIRELWLKDAPPRYALHFACAVGILPAVGSLLSRNCNINEQDENGESPLYQASLEGHSEIVEILLEHGADPGARGGDFGNALQAASHAGHAAIVKILLGYGARDDFETGFHGHALAAASAKCHGAIVEMLLKSSANVKAKGKWYDNALQSASFSGHEQIVQRLLKELANVNAQGEILGNALHAASTGGHREIVIMLLDKGANTKIPGGRYRNGLQAAISRDDQDLAELLIRSGADVNAQGGFFGTCLQAASATGNRDMVNLLIEKGADIHVQGGYYGNCLQAASAHGRKAIVKLLLSNGANVNAKGGPYGTAFLAAKTKGLTEIMKLLIKSGAEVSDKDDVSSDNSESNRALLDDSDN